VFFFFPSLLIILLFFPLFDDQRQEVDEIVHLLSLFMKE